MSEVLLYPLSGDGVRFDPTEVQGRFSGPAAGRMSLQGLLEIKDTHRPSGGPMLLRLVVP